MQFYNTLTRKKENFVPQTSGQVSIYVCGITAYDLCHIGHARAAVVFDVLVRHLRESGYKVKFVRNFTDVDDKIIKRSEEEKISSEEVAQKYIQAFYKDMERLNVLTPDFEPKATEHIQEMQDLVQKLLDKGHAYITPQGDVYFKVRSFEDYGRLSGRNIEELQAGARIAPGEDKEDPLDFALWKRAKPNEPSWPSPWGDGRPGWHIECSAMSEKYLGLPLDIHGGGQDLAFPHHENERAQSMAATGKEFVRYWLHNGFVQVQSEKMSKSLGNFITLRDIFSDYHPEVLRFFLLSKHYRSPLNFTWEGLQETEKGLKRIYQTLQQVQETLKNEKWSKAQLPQEFLDQVKEGNSVSKQALDEDLNTAQVLGQVFNLIRLSNRILEDKTLRKSIAARDLLQKIQESISTQGKTLGLFEQEPGSFLEELRKIKAKRKKIDPKVVEEKIQARQKARKEKDYQTADDLRANLEEMGVEVQDTPEGPVWDVI